MNGITEKNAEKLADFLTDQNKSIEFLDNLIRKNPPSQRLLIKDYLSVMIQTPAIEQAVSE